MDFARVGKMCSFCGKQGGPDTKLAGGLGAMICDDCVATFHENNQSAERVATMSIPPWERMTDAELLATLPLIMRVAEQNSSFAQEWVDLLRSRKISWAEVGKALGVSRQAAWERYAHRATDRSVSA